MAVTREDGRDQTTGRKGSSGWARRNSLQQREKTKRRTASNQQKCVEVSGGEGRDLRSIGHIESGSPPLLPLHLRQRGKGEGMYEKKHKRNVIAQVNPVSAASYNHEKRIKKGNQATRRPPEMRKPTKLDLGRNPNGREDLVQTRNDLCY